MKKLAKSSTNRLFMGVCGGIGEYFNVDATFVRIVCILLIFASFSLVFWGYFILGLVLPYDYQLKGQAMKGQQRTDTFERLYQRFDSQQRTSQQPKDVTPPDEDDWSDF